MLLNINPSLAVMHGHLGEMENTVTSIETVQAERGRHKSP